MKKPVLYSLLSVVLSINPLTSVPAYPWKEKGHEIVGHIAQRRLTEKAWRKIKAILRPKSPVASELAEAAVWPDKIGRTIKDMDPLHYVNFRTGDTGYDQHRNCPLRNCIVEALPWYRRVMVDKDAPLNARRIALRFVAHLVGDIHQPLHAGFEEDKSGNTILVRFKDRQGKLHWWWDTGFLETAEEGPTADIARRLDEAITPEERSAWLGGPIVQWAEKSFELARTHAYDLPDTPGTKVITDDYFNRAMSVIRQRLAQAGVRLAWVLNEAFK